MNLWKKKLSLKVWPYLVLVKYRRDRKGKATHCETKMRREAMWAWTKAMPPLQRVIDGKRWWGSDLSLLALYGGGQAQTHSLLPQELWHGFSVSWESSIWKKCTLPSSAVLAPKVPLASSPGPIEGQHWNLRLYSFCNCFSTDTGHQRWDWLLLNDASHHVLLFYSLAFTFTLSSIVLRSIQENDSQNGGGVLENIWINRMLTPPPLNTCPRSCWRHGEMHPWEDKKEIFQSSSFQTNWWSSVTPQVFTLRFNYRHQHESTSTLWQGKGTPKTVL